MKIKTTRKLAILATTAVIALSGISAAPSASATNSWGGYASCGTSHIQARGYRRAGSGWLFVYATGGGYIMDSTNIATAHSVPGRQGSGLWEVMGTAATRATNTCV